jgi:hypothetical protein
MRRTSQKATSEMLHKIENIGKDILNLKMTFLKNITPGSKKITSLKSIVKGVSIAEQDISSAKKALYNKVMA